MMYISDEREASPELQRSVFKIKNGVAQELTKKEYTPYFEKFFERNWSVGTSTEVVKPIEGHRALQAAITSFPIAAKKYGFQFYKFEYLKKDGVRFSSGCFVPMGPHLTHLTDRPACSDCFLFNSSTARLFSLHRCLPMCSNKKGSKGAAESKGNCGPIKLVNHSPDATWTVDKNGNIDILHHACQFKKHFKITGIDKQFHNVWRSIPRFCESCGQHMKYIKYNGKVVELKDQIVAPPLWWW